MYSSVLTQMWGHLLTVIIQCNCYRSSVDAFFCKLSYYFTWSFFKEEKKKKYKAQWESSAYVLSNRELAQWKLPAIHFLPMTASLSHGSTTNTRLLSKTLTLERGFSATAHTSLYFWLYYMLTLHPFPPFPSATTKMLLSIFFIVFFYVFPHSKKKKKVTQILFVLHC